MQMRIDRGCLHPRHAEVESASFELLCMATKLVYEGVCVSSVLRGLVRGLSCYSRFPLFEGFHYPDSMMNLA